MGAVTGGGRTDRNFDKTDHAQYPFFGSGIYVGISYFSIFETFHVLLWRNFGLCKPDFGETGSAKTGKLLLKLLWGLFYLKNNQLFYAFPFTTMILVGHTADFSIIFIESTFLWRSPEAKGYIIPTKKLVNHLRKSSCIKDFRML